MRLLASIVGVVVAAGFMVIAAVMNWRYGLSLGRSADDELLFAAVGLGVDVTKLLMPFFFWWSLSNRRWMACGLSAVALVACISYSLAGIAGYADLARAVTTGSTLAKQERAEALRKDLQRKQANLDALGVVEPTAVLEQKLDAFRQDVRWRTSRECAEATAPASREFCRTYRNLEADKERSAAFAVAERDIADLRQQIAELATATAIDRGDPRAGILSRLMGLEILPVQTGLSLLFVGIVEFMSTFGMFIALNHGVVANAPRRATRSFRTAGHRARTAREVSTDVPVVAETAAVAETPTISVEDTELVVAAGSAHVAKFAVSCMQPRGGSRILVSSLYPKYCQWCAHERVTPLSIDEFLQSFKELCLDPGFAFVGDGDMLIAEGFEAAA